MKNETLKKLITNLIPSFIIFSVLTTINVMFNVVTLYGKEPYYFFIFIYIFVLIVFDFEISKLEK